MPDLYYCKTEDHSYNAFWHDGEFYLHCRTWKRDADTPEFRYFDTSDECLKAMLEIAPYKDWENTNAQ